MSRDGSTLAPRVAAVVLAGGSGSRMGGGRNKGYLPLGGGTAVGLSLATMAGLPGLRRLVLVVRVDDIELAKRTVESELPNPAVPVELVQGGHSRHSSEERALRHLAPAIENDEVNLVLIHDSARPLCSRALVTELVRTAAGYGGAVPGLPADDIAALDSRGQLTTLSARHVRVQTPQVFAAGPLLSAYERAAEAGFEGTDTSASVERFSSVRIQYVPGEERNFKITYPKDLYLANQLVLNQARASL
jgi:2-C-methyl-D-erythritol 4-phosphate cytidylyltransferase